MLFSKISNITLIINIDILVQGIELSQMTIYSFLILPLLELFLCTVVLIAHLFLKSQISWFASECYLKPKMRSIIAGIIMDGKYSGKTKFWASKEEKKTQTHKDLDFFLVGRMAWQKSRFFKQTEMGPWH